MRLSPAEKKCLITNIRKYRPNAEIFIFGSRADDHARGGDIDILIIDPQKLSLSEASKIEVSFWKEFGEQKLDLVCFTPDSDHPFKQVALLNAKPLR